MLEDPKAVALGVKLSDHTAADREAQRETGMLT